MGYSGITYLHYCFKKVDNFLCSPTGGAIITRQKGHKAGESLLPGPPFKSLPIDAFLHLFETIVHLFREIRTQFYAILVMDENSLFVGVSLADNNIEFGDEFKTVTVDCHGWMYSPGVNPFETDADPVPDTEFSCTPMVFHRITGVGF